MQSNPTAPTVNPASVKSNGGREALLSFRAAKICRFINLQEIRSQIFWQSLQPFFKQHPQTFAVKDLLLSFQFEQINQPSQYNAIQLNKTTNYGLQNHHKVFNIHEVRQWVIISVYVQYRSVHCDHRAARWVLECKDQTGSGSGELMSWDTWTHANTLRAPFVSSRWQLDVVTSWMKPLWSRLLQTSKRMWPGEDNRRCLAQGHHTHNVLLVLSECFFSMKELSEVQRREVGTKWNACQKAEMWTESGWAV